MRALAILPASLGALLVLSGAASAQSLLGIWGGTSASNGAEVFEFTGPPDPAVCSYPDGPVIFEYPTDPPGLACPGLPDFPFGPEGDIAVDQVNDLTYVSDGNLIVSFRGDGDYVGSFFAPLAVAGMGFDSASGLLWLTDGVVFGSVVPPAGCLAPPPGFVSLAGVPIGAGLFGGPLFDLDWDAGSGTLFGCDDSGIVGNFDPGGAPGPFGFFDMSTSFCPIGPILTGIAVDNTQPGAGVVYVTDGFRLAYLELPLGFPAATGFYTTSNCYSIVGVTPTPLSGLAFAARTLRFGAGTSTGGSVPFASGVGQSYYANPTYGNLLFGEPSASTFLLVSVAGPACPAIPIFGLNLLLQGPFPPSPPTPNIPASGALSVAFPLPGALLPGTGVGLQWATVSGLGIGFSNGLYFTVSQP
ncbi:MAG: hypothetical protein AAF682_15975 [Planctomycetota bacterium]